MKRSLKYWFYRNELAIMAGLLIAVLVLGCVLLGGG